MWELLSKVVLTTTTKRTCSGCWLSFIIGLWSIISRCVSQDSQFISVWSLHSLWSIVVELVEFENSGKYGKSGTFVYRSFLRHSCKYLITKSCFSFRLSRNLMIFRWAWALTSRNAMLAKLLKSQPSQFSTWLRAESKTPSRMKTLMWVVHLTPSGVPLWKPN